MAKILRIELENVSIKMETIVETPKGTTKVVETQFTIEKVNIST